MRNQILVLGACILTVMLGSSDPAFAQAPAVAPIRQDILYTLFACGLMGMVGQGARVGVGLKTLTASAAKQGVAAIDLFSLSRLILSLIIGFLAGVVTAFIAWKTGMGPLIINLEDFDSMFRYAVAGYIGVDVIEAFTGQYFEKDPAVVGAVQPTAQSAPRTLPETFTAAHHATVAPPATNVPGTNYPTWALSRDMKQARERYWDAIVEGSNSYGLPISLIGAIGSKESQWGLALKPSGPAGTGDFTRRDPTKWGVALPPDGGWGRGLMQIDWYSHDFAKSGDWQDPTKNILFGCDLFAGLLKQELANGHDHDTAVRRAVSAYNGSSGSHSAYCDDVMARAHWIVQQGLDNV